MRITLTCLCNEPRRPLLHHDRYLILELVLSRRDNDELLVIRQALSERDVAAVENLEARIFEECGFVSMDEYAIYSDQSVFFGAFDAKNECVGMMRLISNGPIAPPILSDAVILDASRAHWQDKLEKGALWELATSAIAPTARRGTVFMGLAKLAYSFARRSGVEFLGAITDPKIMRSQQRVCNLECRQIGPLQRYMGEPEESAPYILELGESAHLDFELFPERKLAGYPLDDGKVIDLREPPNTGPVPEPMTTHLPAAVGD